MQILKDGAITKPAALPGPLVAEEMPREALPLQVHPGGAQCLASFSFHSIWHKQSFLLPLVPSRAAGCYRLGLLHTTPKSKHAVVLISQDKRLPPCDATDMFEVLYAGGCEEASADIQLIKSPSLEGVWRIGHVRRDGRAWKLGIRSGNLVRAVEGWDGEPVMQDASATGVRLLVEGKPKKWRLAMLSCHALTSIRIGAALANPGGHHPIFWQREISGRRDCDASTFTGTSEAQCAAMRSGLTEADLQDMGLNLSQARAVQKLVDCPHGVRLVQGPPGQTAKLPHCHTATLPSCFVLKVSTSHGISMSARNWQDPYAGGASGAVRETGAVRQGQGGCRRFCAACRDVDAPLCV